MSILNAGAHGFLFCGFAIAALYFARFRRDTGDRFFAFFAASFFVMAADELAPFLLEVDAERDVRRFVVRLVAFLLILVAIADKNRPRKKA